MLARHKPGKKVSPAEERLVNDLFEQNKSVLTVMRITGISRSKLYLMRDDFDRQEAEVAKLEAEDADRGKLLVETAEQVKTLVQAVERVGQVSNKAMTAAKLAAGASSAGHYGMSQYGSARYG